MRVLITRPEPDASALAAELTALGHEPIVAPLMEVRFLAPAIDMQDVQAVLFTSANGVRAFAGILSAPPPVPAYVVGPATAAAARDAGWSRIETAAGDVTALAAMVVASLTPEDGALVHVSGRAAAGDLAGMLGAHGFEVRRIVAYDAMRARHMPERALNAFLSGAIDAVMLFSPRSARTYLEALAGAGLLDKARGVKAFCLSQAVADVLLDKVDAPIVVAQSPQTPHLLALLSP